MPAFAYRAADAQGRVVNGVLEGESEAEVVRALEQRALMALTLRRAKSKRRDRAAAATTRIRLRMPQLLEFTRQLKVMLESGVTLLATLGMLRNNAAGNYRQLVDTIAADIQRGATLSEALAAHPYTFDPFYVGTIRAGEAAGVHTEALEELIAYYERRAALKREFVGALTYPAIVVLTLIGACIVMLTWVVPQFTGLFAGMGERLPLPTQILMAASDVVTGHPLLLSGGVLALIAALTLLVRHPAPRAALARATGRLPIVGTIVYLGTVIQFARMMALLERAGLPVLETLKVIEDMLMAGRIKSLTGDIRRKVASGESIAASVAGTNVLPNLLEHMISVGEAAGRIDETLTAAARHYEEEMRVRIRRLTTALEPLLTLMVSGLVLLVALAVFLPMWEMNSLLVKP